MGCMHTGGREASHAERVVRSVLLFRPAFNAWQAVVDPLVTVAVLMQCIAAHRKAFVQNLIGFLMNLGEDMTGEGMSLTFVSPMFPVQELWQVAFLSYLNECGICYALVQNRYIIFLMCAKDDVKMMPNDVMRCG